MDVPTPETLKFLQTVLEETGPRVRSMSAIDSKRTSLVAPLFAVRTCAILDFGRWCV
jgi:hypothetical protein